MFCCVKKKKKNKNPPPDRDIEKSNKLQSNDWDNDFMEEEEFVIKEGPTESQTNRRRSSSSQTKINNEQNHGKLRRSADNTPSSSSLATIASRRSKQEERLSLLLEAGETCSVRTVTSNRSCATTSTDTSKSSSQKTSKSSSRKASNPPVPATNSSKPTSRKTSNTKVAKPKKIEHRKCLPVPRDESDFSIWSLLKSTIGKDLTKISMPVIINEPVSFVQRTTEYMEYYYLLNKAAKTDDPVVRMELLLAFIVSGLSNNYDRLTKPFNPLLGETFEYTRLDLGFRYVGEQVLHHPPVTAFHVDGAGYVFYGTVEPKIKFYGRTVDIIPKGQMYLKFSDYNETYTWHYPNCSVNNLFMGKMFLLITGKMTVEKLNSKSSGVINFKTCDWASAQHFVEGFVIDDSGIKKRVLYGNWVLDLCSCTPSDYDKKMSSKEGKNTYMNVVHKNHQKKRNDPERSASLMSFNFECPNQTLLWEVDNRPANAKKFFNFTWFSISLNEILPEMKVPPHAIAPTDSRLRPDIRAMENGNLDLASSEKTRLEDKQRARKPPVKARWFVWSTQPDTQNEEWMFNNKYWKRQWGACPDLF